MAAPARGVLASPVSRCRCPVQDALDAAPYPAGGLGLCCPDRLQNPHDQCQIDVLHRRIPEHRPYIGIERGLPLCAMLLVFPFGAMAFDVLPPAVHERLGRFPAYPRLQNLVVAGCYRIDARQPETAGLCCLLPRVGQGDDPEGSQAHLAGLPSQHISIGPGLRAGAAYLQVEPATVVIESRPGLLSRPQGGESVDAASHCLPMNQPTNALWIERHVNGRADTEHATYPNVCKVRCERRNAHGSQWT